MRKTLALIVTISLLFVFTSAHNSDTVDATIGSFAPNFAVGEEGNIQRLSDYRGVYVLLNFWSSQDAVSRIRNNELNRFASKKDDEVKLISVNFDRSEKLFREVLKLDNLSEKNHFYDNNGDSSDLYKRYHLEFGYKSILLDKEGKVVAINPTQQELTKIICQ